MSVAYELAEAINETEHDFYLRDSRGCWDRYERRDKVHAKTRLGMSADEIAGDIGVTQRNVVRMRGLPPAPDVQVPPDPMHITEERAEELEELAHTAMALALRLRDENPMLTWAALLKLDHRALLELTVVVLAILPIDMRVSELCGWITDLPAAQENAQ